MIKKRLKYLFHFYGRVGHKLWIGLLLGAAVGVLDGLGLSLFLPLFALLEPGDGASGDDEGLVGLVSRVFGSVGLEANLTTVLSLIIAIFLLKGLFKFFEGVFNVNLRTRFILEVRNQGVALLNRFAYKNFSAMDAGRINNTLVGEAGRVIGAYNHYFRSLQNGLFVLIYLVLAFFSNSKFTLVVLVAAALTNLIFRGFYKKTSAYSRALTQTAHRYQSLVSQGIHFFKYLRSTNGEKKFSEQILKAIHGLEEYNRKIGLNQAFLVAIREPIAISIIALAIVVQTVIFKENIGFVLLSLVFFYRALNYVMLYQTSWNDFLSVTGSVDNLEKFHEELSSQAEVFGTQEVGKLQSLSLRNVSYSHDGVKKALDGIDLDIQSRKTHAFVGESGSGKTTLVNLISGILVPISGDYLINGHPVTSVDIASFRSRIGYITQEPVIFDDTVFNNVTFWDERNEDTEARCKAALEEASILDFVNTLLKQLDAPLGNNGILISGGQKQRLAIARELYKQPDLLIMDEATAALDVETEHIIQQNIDRMTGKYTILIVAHRMSTIQNANYIHVMQQGRIESTGSFESLLEHSESFKKFIKLQNISESN